jgi:HNH endonuclease
LRNIGYFENRVWKDEATSCWNWMLRLGHNGYGKFLDTDRTTRRAHRGAWEAVNGPIPAGLHVLHRCDNRRCCNPEHLFLGTQQDNMKDRDSKGRHAMLKGSRVGNSKLTEHNVSIIKMLLGLGVEQDRLATLYDVSQGTVSLISIGSRWKHVAPMEAPCLT